MSTLTKVRTAGAREKFDAEDVENVTATGTQTLTNKTMTTPVISTFYKDAAKTKLMTVPDVTSDTLATLAAAQTLTNKTLTTPIVASMYQDAGKTKLMSLPDTASDTLVSLAAAQTLTNKTVKKTITAYAADGAIAIASGIVNLTKTSAGAYTLAAPAAGDAGTIMHITAGTDYAHVISIATTSLLDGTNTPKGKATTAAYIGSGITIAAVGLKWHLLSNNATTLAAS